MNEYLNTVLKNTYTLSQLKHRLKVLKTHLSRRIFGGEGEDVAPADSLWLQSLPLRFIQSFNKDNITEIFPKLEEIINQMDILTVYLPFEADDMAINQIGSKARDTFGKLLLLDLKYNPALLAGCALSWKGVYRDFSLHQRIQERKLAIIQNLKKFLR